MTERALACSAVGSPETVRRGVAEFLAVTGVDEVMVTAQIHDPAARVRSFEIAAQVWDAPATEVSAAA